MTSTEDANFGTVATERQRRSDGERTYQAIVRASAELATIDGLHGLSIARLADHVGISKSGLYAHFRSKEELQLATIEAAGEIFEEEVVRPTEGEPTARGTLEALCRALLLARRTPGVPRRLLLRRGIRRGRHAQGPSPRPHPEFMLGWIDKLRDLIVAAQEEGTIDASEDPVQLAYELEAAMMLANNLFVLTDGRTSSNGDGARSGACCRSPSQRIRDKGGGGRGSSPPPPQIVRLPESTANRATTRATTRSSQSRLLTATPPPIAKIIEQ